MQGNGRLWRWQPIIRRRETTPSLAADSDVSDVRLMRETWQAYGAENPMFYVNSLGQGLDEKFTWNPEEFFASGRGAIDAMTEFFPQRNYSSDRLLEIGCGVGRESIHFSKVFKEVVALDISLNMVLQARLFHVAQKNLNFIVGDGQGLSQFRDAAFDAAYSSIVFQHITDARITLGYIRDVARILRPDGVFVFQLFDRPDAQPTSPHPWQCTRVGIPRLEQLLPLCGLRLLGYDGENSEWLWVTTVRTDSPQVPAAEWIQMVDSLF